MTKDCSRSSEVHRRLGSPLVRASLGSSTPYVAGRDDHCSRRRSTFHIVRAVLMHNEFSPVIAALPTVM